MRRSTLLLLFTLAACGAEREDVYVVVEDFLARARPTSCEEVSIGSDVAVSELRLASDSTWLVLDEVQRRILEVDEDYRTVWSLTPPSNGPGSLIRPVSVSPLGDSAFAVVDRGSLRLVVLSRSGEELRSTPLGFLPHSVEGTRSGAVLVTPLPFGGKPGTLLVRFDGATPQELPVPPRYYEDVMIRAMGNATLVEALPDGRALVLHQYLAPRGFSVAPGGAVTRLAVPTPDLTIAMIDQLPALPLNADGEDRILLPALAMSVDPLRSEVYILTRTGRKVDGVPERAILRLDDRLAFIEAFTVVTGSAEMVFLPRRATALLADDQDRIFACPLPLTVRPDARTG